MEEFDGLQDEFIRQLFSMTKQLTSIWPSDLVNFHFKVQHLMMHKIYQISEFLVETWTVSTAQPQRPTQCRQGGILYGERSGERTPPKEVVQTAVQAENNIPRNLETILYLDHKLSLVKISNYGIGIPIFDGSKKEDFFVWLEKLETACLQSGHDICLETLTKAGVVVSTVWHACWPASDSI